jgi:uncharacterized membrane protein
MVVIYFREIKIMAKKAAMVFGVIFVLIGVLGFLSSPILGLFAVNMLHNIVHVVLGIILIVAAKGEGAGTALKVISIIYLVVALLGFFMATDGMLFGILEVNTADNWLHLVLAIVLFGASKGGMKAMPMMNNASSTPSNGGMNNNM